MTMQVYEKRYRYLVRRLEPALNVEQRRAPPKVLIMTFKTVFAGFLSLGVAGCAGITQTSPSPPRPKVEPAFTLHIRPDKPEYRRNDTTVLRVVASRDCALTIGNVDKTGLATQIFPNRFQKPDIIQAGIPVFLGGAGSPFKLRLGDAGRETVIASCRALTPTASSSDKPIVARRTIVLRVK